MFIDCVAPCVAEWGQCGGIGYSGETDCCAPTTCQVGNPWYSQCLQGTTQPTTTQSTTTTISTTTQANSSMDTFFFCFKILIICNFLM